MALHQLLLKNPLRFLENNTGNMLPTGGFGAVTARAGVGKTALLVQIALYSMLNQKKVLHISLEDPVRKVGLWYEEVFHLLSKSVDNAAVSGVWEQMIANRFIMTFRASAFSASTLEERLTDLIDQHIFLPDLLLIDGLPFDADEPAIFTELKALATRLKVHIWFTVRSHRHQSPGPDGMPVQLQPIADMFDIILRLDPQGAKVHVNTLLQSGNKLSPPSLVLDPATMLLK